MAGIPPRSLAADLNQLKIFFHFPGVLCIVLEVIFCNASKTERSDYTARTRNHIVKNTENKLTESDVTPDQVI